MSVDIAASQDRVWGIISDLDGEPKFWKGTKSVRNLTEPTNQDGDTAKSSSSTDTNLGTAAATTIKREIIIAFRDQKCEQTVTIQPKTKIHAVFTKGIIAGTKTMTLLPKSGEVDNDDHDDDKHVPDAATAAAAAATTTLQVQWDIKLTGLMGVFTSMIKNHIKNGTQQAVNSIKEHAER